MTFPKLCCALWIGCLGSLGGAALAGPEYTEPPGDAGNRKATATDVSMLIGAGHISGALTGVGSMLGTPPDFEDMYIINITQPGQWLATTSPLVPDPLNPPTGGHAEFDSVLWLFEFTDERGLLANNTFMPGDTGARLINQSTDGTGVTISVPGLYLLAISVAGRTPVDFNGTPIFEFVGPNEISGPDGSMLPLDHWVGQPSSPIPGQYTILIVPSPGGAGILAFLSVAAIWRRR
ncbi:MAG TPA: hypothetical protein VG797_00205 [Phycisphaerales bacterium]|nr:hypothetical protein [Phycisphaerales bacterium]